MPSFIERLIKDIFTKHTAAIILFINTHINLSKYTETKQLKIF